MQVRDLINELSKLNQDAEIEVEAEIDGTPERLDLLKVEEFKRFRTVILRCE